MSSSDLFVFTRGEGASQRSYSYPVHEAKTLALQLGMDLDTDSEFIWFLQEALVTILPQGWKKEANASGTAQYHNLKTGVTTETHPLLYIFRAAYHHLLETTQLAQGESTPKDTETPLPSNENPSHYFADLLKRIEKKQDSVKSTVRFEQAMRDAELFYSSLLSGTSVPKHIEDSLEYQSVEPERMLELARALGVQDEYRLMWVARVFAVLPLPPLWKRSHDPYRNDLYLNTHYNVTLGFHPSKNFLYKYIQTLRFGSLEGSSTMTFLDRHYRSYDIDLHRLMAGEDYIIKIRDFPGQRYLPSTLFRPKVAFSHETIEGIMALDMAEDDVEMLGLVYRYYSKVKDRLKGWEFRYTLQGERYWYHADSMAGRKKYPFSEKLKKLLSQTHAMHQQLLPSVLKDSTEIHPTLLTSTGLSKLRKAAVSLMSRHLSCYLSGLPTDSLEIADTILSLPYLPNSTQELMDLLYSNPFRLIQPMDTISSLQLTSMETDDDYGLLSPKQDQYDVTVDGKSILSIQENGAHIRSLKALLARPRASRNSQFLEQELIRNSGLKSGNTERNAGAELEKLMQEMRKSQIGEEKLNIETEEKKSLLSTEKTMEDEKNSKKNEEIEKSDTIQKLEKTDKAEKVDKNSKTTTKRVFRQSVKFSDQEVETDFVSSSPSQKSPSKFVLTKSKSFKGALLHPPTPTDHRLTAFPQGKRNLDAKNLIKTGISGVLQKIAQRKSVIFDESEKMKGKDGEIMEGKERKMNEGELDPILAENKSSDSEKSDEMFLKRENSSISASKSTSNYKALLSVFLRKQLSLLADQIVDKEEITEKIDVFPVGRGRLKTRIQSGKRLFASEDGNFSSSPKISSPAGSTLPSASHSRQVSATKTASQSALNSPGAGEKRHVIGGKRTLKMQGFVRKRSIGREKMQTMVSFFTGKESGNERKVGRNRGKFGLKGGLEVEYWKNHSNSRSPSPTNVMTTTLPASGYLRYYFQTCGNPCSTFDLRLYPPHPKLTVPDIVEMGVRLGIKVSTEPLESQESDLLWIAYVQLLVPLPPQWLGELGEHPGDEYFHLVLEYHRERRNRLLKAMSRLERIRSLLDSSWLELQPKPGVFLLHNFLTHEEGPSSSLSVVKFSFQPSRAAATAPGQIRRR